MTAKLKNTNVFNTLKKISTTIGNAVAVPNCQTNQECNSEEKISQDSQKDQALNFPVKKKLNFKNLKRQLIAAGSDAHEEAKNKFKTTVNLELMKEELKQLEDPPLTQREKDLMSSRLTYTFFDQPCEQLAQNLLGKILVRKLENGTILKGRIVETESYLGTVDKASHTYEYRVSARNLPMYMPPGTIYVYFTYGMYHCFNLSSQEPGSRVQIRSLDPLVGLNYMELLLNTKQKKGQQEKEMVENIQQYKAHDLCNDPSKICTAFNIESDIFDKKHISQCLELWIEKDLKIKSLNIIAVPNLETHLKENELPGKSDGCAILIRAVEPIEGQQEMIENRNSIKKSSSKQSRKEFKSHELCNGPSKLCMAYLLDKRHNKYSLCSWKGLWIEDNSSQEEMKIVKCKRIGIESCGAEWANKPLRYYIYNNKSVSKRDKKAEADCLEKT